MKTGSCEFPRNRKIGSNIGMEFSHRVVKLSLKPNILPFRTWSGGQYGVCALQRCLRINRSSRIFNIIPWNTFKMEFLETSLPLVGLETLAAKYVTSETAWACTLPHILRSSRMWVRYTVCISVYVLIKQTDVTFCLIPQNKLSNTKQNNKYTRVIIITRKKKKRKYSSETPERTNELFWCQRWRNWKYSNRTLGKERITYIYFF